MEFSESTHANASHPLALLRPRRQRPRGGAGEQRGSQVVEIGLAAGPETPLADRATFPLKFRFQNHYDVSR
jgi:hypothetical protein